MAYTGNETYQQDGINRSHVSAGKIFLRLAGTAAVLLFLIYERELFFGASSYSTYNYVIPPLENDRTAVFWTLVAVTVLSGTDAVRMLWMGERIKRHAFGKPSGTMLSLLVIFLNSILSFFEMELINNYYLYEVMDFRYHLLGWLITFFLYLILVFLTNSVSLGMCIGNWVFAVWGIVNFFVLKFRGVPLQWIDFGSIRTAMSVAGNYTYTLTWQIVAVIVMTCAVTGFYIHAGLWHNVRTVKGGVASRVISLGLAVSFWGLIFQTNFLADQGIWLRDWQPWFTYHRFGMEAGFFAFAKASYPTPPDSYSKAHVEDIISASEKKDTEDEKASGGVVPENIICIMDEAFSDFSIYPHFNADQDVMPFLNSMSENTQQGRLLVSVKGGTTANTEYEFLTGNSCVLSPTTVVYNSFIKQDQYSLARILKAQGYQAIALHPYGKYGWNRNVVYPRMGFDDFLSIDNYFQDAAKVRGFVSDEADFETLIDFVKQKDKGQKLFLFNITMQNHSAYKNPAFEATIHIPDFEGENKGQAEQYLTLTHMTDQAVKKLIDYFSNSDEKTMIVFWGDHQPEIGDDFWEYCLGTDTMSSLSYEQQELTYETRYFIWANYDIPEAKDQLLSANYLGSYMLSLTGLKTTGYQNFLLRQRESIPAMNSYGYYDIKGQVHEWRTESAGEKETAALDDYENLIYHELTGGKSRDGSFYGLPSS